jgi:lipopolysaccharide export system protein LptC
MRSLEAAGVGRGRPAGAAKRSRYGGTVGLLRVVLPAVALSMVALAVLWPQLMGGASGLIAPIFANAKVDGTDVMLMHNPRYAGQTNAAEPFEVTAASAYADPAHPDRIHMEQMAAQIATAGPRDLSVMALAGTYDRTSEKLDLSGGIKLSTSDGYRFETPSAQVNLQGGEVSGTQPIQGAGPPGTLSADRFEIREGGQVLRFEGRVKVTLPPRQGGERAS